MPLEVRTRFFGCVDCAPEDVITFPAGIPPFVEYTRFIVISDEKQQPLMFLQSVDLESLCFIAIPIRGVDPAYELAVEPEDLRLLGRESNRRVSIDDFCSLAILTIPESGPVTANLLAPILIDTAARLGVQAIRADARYRCAHLLDQPSDEHAYQGETAC